MKNEKGIIILSVVMSLLMVMAAVIVFSVVSGRFGTTLHFNKRQQALRDAEVGVYVVGQMKSEAIAGWTGNNVTKTIVLAKPDGGKLTLDVTVNNAQVDTTADYY